MSGLKTMSFRLIHALAFTLAAHGASAQTDYPDKPVKIVIPFAVGGAMDTLARPMGESYQRSAGQPWVVENVGGAGGTIAAMQVLRGRPDGYQLLFGSNAPISISPLIYPTLGYEPQDLEPVVHVADSSNVLYASVASGLNSVREIVTRATQRPDSLNFAHAGIGSLGHLSVELLAKEAKVSFTGVAYKGSGAALVDLASGQVQLLFTNVSTAQPLVAAGKIRPIAVASEQRLKSIPEVPTFAELGYPKVVAKLWTGLMAPKGTPQPVIDRMARQVLDLLRDPALRARLEAQGWEVQAGSAAQFRTVIEQDTSRWRELSKTVNLSSK